MPPNGCAAIRRPPGTKERSRAPGGVVLVTFAETQFCREQNWAHFSAPAGPKPGMASVKSHPGWSLLRIHAPATFAHPCAAQGSRSNPQVAFKVKSRQRRLLTIYFLDPAPGLQHAGTGSAGVTTTQTFSRIRAALPARSRR